MPGLYLFANVNFIPGKYNAWQAAYDDLAKYVFKHEKATQSYYFGIPFDYSHEPEATTLMFAFEVYDARTDLYDVHLKSDAMSTFLSKALPTMTTGLDLMHYGPAGGFLDRHGDKRECDVMQDCRIWCQSEKDRDAVLGRLELFAKDLESNGDGDVYTFLITKGLDDATELRIFSRFKDQTTTDRHLASAGMLKFWNESKSEIKKMESRGYFPNGKGWLHR